MASTVDPKECRGLAQGLVAIMASGFRPAPDARGLALSASVALEAAAEMAERHADLNRQIEKVREILGGQVDAAQAEANQLRAAMHDYQEAVVALGAGRGSGGLSFAARQWVATYDTIRAEADQLRARIAELERTVEGLRDDRELLFETGERLGRELQAEQNDRMDAQRELGQLVQSIRALRDNWSSDPEIALAEVLSDVALLLDGSLPAAQRAPAFDADKVRDLVVSVASTEVHTAVAIDIAARVAGLLTSRARPNPVPTVGIGPADTAIIDEALAYWSKVCSAAPHADIARIRALLASPGGGS